MQFDPEGTGHVRYHVVMKELLDADTYAMWAGANDPLKVAMS